MRIRTMVWVSAVVVSVLVTPVVWGQNWVEERTFVSKGTATPRINGLLTSPMKGKWGSFVWFQIQKDYSQGYAGLTYSPRSWMQFALGGGLEQDKHPARVGGYMWAGNSKSSLLFVPEYGGSGFWWKLEANRKINKSVGVGFITERFKGSGLRVEYKIPKIPVVVWGAPLLQMNRQNLLIGIRWNL